MAKRLSYEEVKAYIEGEEGNGCRLLSEEYEGNNVKLKIACKCNESFETKFSTFKTFQKQCKKCGMKVKISKLSLNYEQIEEYINGENGNGCKLVSKEYINSQTKLKIKCRCGEEFSCIFGNFKNNNKKQCNDCGKKIAVLNLRLKYKDVKEYIEGINGNGCKLVSQEYLGNDYKMEIVCACKSMFKATFQNFKDKNQKQCPECGRNNQIQKRKLRYSEVKSYIEIESQSNCKLLSNEYVNNRTKINIVCACGELFNTTFDEFKAGKNKCNKCVSQHMSKLYRLDLNDIKKRALNTGSKILNEFYVNQRDELIIKCSCGEVFSRLANSVIQNQEYDCRECRLKKINEENMLKMRRKIINYAKKNNINLVEKGEDYCGRKSKVSIKCRCGNVHKLTYSAIKNNKQRTCPNCSPKSKAEEIILDFLQKNNLLFEREFRINNCKNKKVLPFDFSIKNDRGLLECLIEFDGQQHFKSTSIFGGQKSFERQQLNDQIKNKYCEEKGIPLLRIPYWEINNVEVLLEEFLQGLGLLEGKNEEKQ